MRDRMVVPCRIHLYCALKFAKLCPDGAHDAFIARDARR